MKSQWFKHIFGVTAIFLMATAQAQTTERVSVDSLGVQGDQRSSSIPSISADGRFVAFLSQAGNLVADDTNGLWDVFVHDRQTGMTERVSVDSHGFEGDGSDSSELFASISVDGRYVAFVSQAGNLVADDTNDLRDVFVHDRHTGMIERVSVDSHGNEGNGNSSSRPSISADGRFVSFVTLANNLSLQDTNLASDVYVHDRNTGITELISVGIDGMAAGSSIQTTINADGRFVAFRSSASNLVAGDSINRPNVFVRDRLLGMTERVSKAPDGSPSEPGLATSCCDISISADGRYVAYSSIADDKLLPEETNQLADVFVYDRLADTTERVGIAFNDSALVSFSFLPSMNATGRFVSFLAFDNDGGDDNGVFDVFVRDRALGTLERISVDDLGIEGNDRSGPPAISADGRWVAFSSDADNLVAGDTNNATDMFVRGPLVSLQPADLLADLVDMVITLNLQAGISNSLDAKLSAVEKALDDLIANNNVAAINALEAFIAEVEAQTGNKISEADALLLIAAARQTIALIEFT